MNLRLDLHGVKHKDVFTHVDKFIGEHILLGNLQVQIITGHSDKMKKLVKEVLVDYGIESEQSFFDNSTLNIKLT
tara:strand:- start:1399 stop:1623 length:225 start_codon:yes stop_codon:yes gene_type:complete